MNEKTMRKWFKTFLMLLPFLFLAIFAIAVRKDGLKYEVQGQPPYEIYDVENQYNDFVISDDEYIVPVEDMLDESQTYIKLYYDGVEFFQNLGWNGGYIILGQFNDQDETMIRLDYYNDTIEFMSKYSTDFSNQITQGLAEYFDDFSFDIVNVLYVEDFIDFDNNGAQNLIEFEIYAPYVSNQNNLTFNFDNSDIMPKVLKQRSQEPRYVEGPQAVLLHFNDMIEDNFNINAFGMNDFYDWMDENWFDNNTPLIVKPVFTLLIYEAIIELIFLMFSFLTFVIRFAQQWIDGIYSKGGKK